MSLYEVIECIKITLGYVIVLSCIGGASYYIVDRLEKHNIRLFR